MRLALAGPAGAQAVFSPSRNVFAPLFEQEVFQVDRIFRVIRAACSLGAPHFG
jgi:hypothetical protein